MHSSKLILIAEALALAGSAAVLPRSENEAHDLSFWNQQICQAIQAWAPRFPVQSSEASAFCTSALNLNAPVASAVSNVLKTITVSGTSTVSAIATTTVAPPVSTLFVSTATCYTAPMTSSAAITGSAAGSSSKPSASASLSKRDAAVGNVDCDHNGNPITTTTKASSSAPFSTLSVATSNSLNLPAPSVVSACSCWGYTTTSAKTTSTVTSTSTTTSTTVVATVTSFTSTSTSTNTALGSTVSGTSTSAIPPFKTFAATDGSTYDEWAGYDFYGNDLSLSPCAGGNFTTPAGSFACNGFEGCENVCSQYNKANVAQGSPNPPCVGISYTLGGQFCYLKSLINNCGPIVNTNVNSGMLLHQN